MLPAHLLAGIEIFFASTSLTGAAHLNNVHGQMTDSPCRLRMNSRDQAINLGSVPAGNKKLPGTRSTSDRFTLWLEDCLMASGYIRDEQTVGALLGMGRPAISVSLTALDAANVPSLIRLAGVKEIGLLNTDKLNRHTDLKSHGTPLLLTPCDNVPGWDVAVERTPESLVTGPFQAIAGFRASYD